MRYYKELNSPNPDLVIECEPWQCPYLEQELKDGTVVECDAQGTPLNAGSGNSFWITTTGTVTPQQLNANWNAIGNAISVGAKTCSQDHNIIGGVIRGIHRYCHECGEELSSTVAAPKTPDDAEQKLLDKVLPKFNGEASCNPPPIKGYPTLPYFANAPERNEESRRVLKRWLSTNLKDWPVCRFERTPLNLIVEGRPMRDDPYGGEKAVPQFHCPSCGRYGEVG